MFDPEVSAIVHTFASVAGNSYALLNEVTELKNQVTFSIANCDQHSEMADRVFKSGRELFHRIETLDATPTGAPQIEDEFPDEDELRSMIDCTLCDLAQIKAKNKHLESQIRALELEEQGLQQELDSHRNDVQRIEIWEPRIEEFDPDIHESIQNNSMKIEELRADLLQYQVKKEMSLADLDFGTVDNPFEWLDSQLEVGRRRSLELEAEIDALKSALRDSYNHQNENFHSKLLSTQSALDVYDQETKTLHLQLDSLKVELNQADSELDASQESLAQQKLHRSIQCSQIHSDLKVKHQRLLELRAMLSQQYPEKFVPPNINEVRSLSLQAEIQQCVTEIHQSESEWKVLREKVAEVQPQVADVRTIRRLSSDHVQ